jgi:hypothetical protein
MLHPWMWIVAGCAEHRGCAGDELDYVRDLRWMSAAGVLTEPGHGWCVCTLLQYNNCIYSVALFLQSCSAMQCYHFHKNVNDVLQLGSQTARP